MNHQDQESESYNLITNSSWLEIRLFYVRITPCVIDSVPDHLTLRHLRREISTPLEINGSTIPGVDSASVSLRRDRLNKESSEVTYVSTDSVRVTGAVEFEVLENKDLFLSEDGGIGACRRSLYRRVFGGVPVILTKTILVSPRRKGSRHGMLDVIPEDDEMETEKVQNDGGSNGSVRLRKVQPAQALPLVVTINCIEDCAIEQGSLAGVASVEHVPLSRLADGKIESAAAVLLHSLAYLPRAAQRRLRPYQFILCLGSANRAVDSALAADLGSGLFMWTRAGRRDRGHSDGFIPWFAASDAFAFPPRTLCFRMAWLGAAAM
ncbi:hypothetical protein GH714_020481 [Hevea brasiliensis]|uniref:Uncharacterized protein n=1 Tax=Hevea brasiliensis TaxID=3981 RepID=A0A6A6KUN6_HEVBR|nr:hypothetical protein GH714_020481 [Hevea brasiliensis]